MTTTSIEYLLLCIGCYLVGAIPFAYLILKHRHQLDIRNEGTGNVGAMNAFDVTGSKFSSITVFFLDFLKGLIPTLILIYVFHLSSYFIVVPLVMLVLGHNFSVFIKFKGGRGLATATGIFLIINFWLIIYWCLLYLIVYKIKKNVHIATVIALVLMPIVMIFTQDWILPFTYGFGMFGKNAFELLFALSSSIVIVILLKHINPIFELITNNKNER